jgi:hypothetical protein
VLTFWGCLQIIPHETDPKVSSFTLSLSGLLDCTNILFQKMVYASLKHIYTWWILEADL